LTEISFKYIIKQPRFNTYSNDQIFRLKYVKLIQAMQTSQVTVTESCGKVYSVLKLQKKWGPLM